MIFVVTLVGLLIERFFDWSHLRHWNWFASYQRLIVQRLPAVSPYVALAVSIVPLLLLVAIVDLMLVGVMYGFIRLIFELVVFLYCLGPKNLWADSYACINALVQSDKHAAAETLKNSFGISDASYTQSLHRHLLNSIFINANRRVFALVFWYVILGVAGAVLYRVSTLASPDNAQEDTVPVLSQSERMVESILNWLPVRLFTFLFALAGQFNTVIACWTKKAVLGLDGNEEMLTECGKAALGLEGKEKLPSDGSVERNAVSLLDRVFVITLVIVGVVMWVV